MHGIKLKNIYTNFNNDFIKIYPSWLGKFLYCKYSFYLENVKGIKVPSTQAMLDGTNSHKEKENVFLEEAVEGTWEEFFDSNELVISREVSLGSSIDDIQLNGIIDEIAVDKNGIYIIDDKPSAVPYPGIKLQIYAYCLLIKSIFPSINKPIYSVIRKIDKPDEIWKELYESSQENDVRTALRSLKNILLGNKIPEKIKEENKCRKCRLKSVCMNE